MAEVSAIDPKRPTRLVVIGYLLLAVALGLFFEHALAAIFGAFRWNDANLVGDWTISSLIGYVLAIAVVVGAWLNPRLNELSFEVASELRKVSWPSGEETRSNTIAVVVFSFFCAAVLFLFDTVASKIMTHWIPSALDAVARHI